MRRLILQGLGLVAATVAAIGTNSVFAAAADYPTRPVNLMVACRLANVRMEQTVPWVGWLLVWFAIAALAVLFVPELALWLPRSLGY